MELSFIVPVYNTEKYLEECINSIISQMTDRCELIIIDDGSTDSSGLLCDTFLNYKNVSVMHNRNSGPSYSRNMGIQLAKGRYVSFVDSDDLLNENSVSNILNWISTNNNEDICFLDACKFFSNGESVNLGDDIYSIGLKNKDANDAIEYLSKGKKFSGSACTKIFNRDFLINNKLEFPDNRMLCEDLVFVMNCMYAANTFDALDILYYKYRQDSENSRSKSDDISIINGCLYFVDKSVDLLCNEKKAKDYRCCRLMSFVAYEYAQILMIYNRLDFGHRRQYKNRIKEYGFVLNYASEMKIRIINFLFKVLGMSLTGLVIRVIKRISR